MQTREDLIKRLKQLGVTTCQRVGPYLVLGGVATNLYILTAPQQVLDTQTCESARSRLDNHASLLAILNAVLVADTGIFIFNTVGATRAIVIPMGHWAYNKVAELLPALPMMSKYRSKSLEIFENELIKAISTGMFLSMLPLSRTITLPFLPIALLPLGRIFLKHQLAGYTGSAAYQQYHETYSDRPWLVNSLTAIESISTGVNLGGSLSALSYFLINAFYDSSHESDWPYQNVMMNSMAALGMVAGMASVFNAQAHRAGNHFSNTVEMFYLICMPLLSMTMCFAPQLEDMSTFMQESIYVVLGVAAFSLLMAEMHTRLTDELDESELRVEEIGSEEESEEEYISIPPESIIAPEPANARGGYGTFFPPFVLPRRAINDREPFVGDRYNDAKSSSSSFSSDTLFDSARSSSSPSSSPRGNV